jgi:hypothetical protein
MCTERSGSNLLTSLAGAFQGMSAPPPTHLFRIFAHNRSNYGDLTNDRNWRVLVEDVVENFGAKLGLWNTEIAFDELVTTTPRDAFELLRCIYAQEAQVDAAVNSFVKENHTYQFAETLARYFADCRFVFLVRDPRDVASSWVRTDSIPGGVEKAVDTWVEDQTGTLAVCDVLRREERVFMLRYEDLISQPGTQLNALADFFGLPFTDSIFDFYKHPRTSANAERIQAWKNIGRPIMRDNSGEFERVLSDSEIRYVELRCGRLMERFGYALRLSSNAVFDTDEVERLRPHLNVGRYVIDAPAELAIRQRRLMAIKRVVERRLT